MVDRHDLRPSHGPDMPRISPRWWAVIGADNRTRRARRFRDLCLAYAVEIDGELTLLDIDLIRRAAALALRSEELQAVAVKGEPISDDAAIRLSGEACRVLEQIRARAPGAQQGAAGPSLLDRYHAERAARAAKQDDEDTNQEEAFMNTDD